MLIKEIALVLLILCIPCVLCVYIGYKLFVVPGFSLQYRLLGWFILLFFLLMTPLSVLFRKSGLENTATDILSWIGYTGLGFMSIVIVFFLLSDGFLFLVHLFKLLPEKLFSFSFFSPNLKHPEKRLLLSQLMTAGILATSGVLTAYGISRAKDIPPVTTIQVPVQDLPDELADLVIIQITDLHISATIKKKWVTKMVQKVNSLNPDIIVFTGDIADGSPDRLKADIEPLKTLKATYGVFYVTGNHDYYSGIGRWMQAINQLGFRILLNEHIIIEHGNGKLLIGGVTDYRAGHFLKPHTSSPQKAMAGAPVVDCKILLAHQPLSIFEAEKQGIDLQLSGHTHGGQYLPWNYFIKLDQPYVAGLHKYKSSHIYVSKGTGYWGPPMRIGVPSEITHIKLKNTVHN